MQHQEESNQKPYDYFSSDIDKELKKRRKNWFLTSVNWIDFDDVCQIIRTHIFRKWDQWDQQRPLKPWLNKIISNQFKNILRNYYSNYARPCLNCPFNIDAEENGCSFTASKMQDSTCPLYKKWNGSKKHAYNIKITVPIEGHIHELKNGTDNISKPLEESVKELIDSLKKVLNKRQLQAFDLLYIQNLSDEEVAKRMGFKSSESGRKAGYKQIKNLKNTIKEKAEKILAKEDIIF
mgnify:FL=1|tara:strand:+ start:2954 stop:3661 length:708 start_codon:yes stop_codon:yes gene_type:complete